jgi:hypothetical protein
MSAFDDDPEYEAQLKEILGSSYPETQDDEEMGDFVGGDDLSEDGVLEDAPTFRLKLPSSAGRGKEPEHVSDIGIVEGKALSEDARSISTGDDSPSVQVHSLRLRLT